MTESCLHTISNQKREERAEQLSLTSTGSRPGPVNERVITKLTGRVIHPTLFMLTDDKLITLLRAIIRRWEVQRDLTQPPPASASCSTTTQITAHCHGPPKHPLFERWHPNDTHSHSTLLGGCAMHGFPSFGPAKTCTVPAVTWRGLVIQPKKAMSFMRKSAKTTTGVFSLPGKAVTSKVCSAVKSPANDTKSDIPE